MKTKKEEIKNCRVWYDRSYKQEGFQAQRLYPNEELLRFMGREYLSKVDRAERRKIKVLELACGSCANLWMIAKEDFDAYGIDVSPFAIKLGRLMLQHWRVKADLRVGTITDLPYKDGFFDVAFDIISAHCLSEGDFNKSLDELGRVLKKGGKFFSYHISTNSDAFKNYRPSRKIDRFTLDGIKRKSSPFAGNDYPCRFISPAHYKEILAKKGFNVTYLETVSRTYGQMREYFEFVIIVGEKE